MKAYVANHAFYTEYEAECDDPSLPDGGVKDLAFPRCTHVLASMDPAPLMKGIEQEYAKMLEPDKPGTLTWGGWSDEPHIWTFTMMEGGADVAVLMIRMMDVE